jgi:hypothetical protein
MGVYRERWIDLVHARRPPDGIILDIDSSESPIHDEQEGFQPRERWRADWPR